MKNFLKSHTLAAATVVFCVLAISCRKDHDPKPVIKPVVITASGNITAQVDEFRKLLGEPLNVAPGNTSGRREINWDAVPDQFINTSIPKNFFSATADTDPASRKRGFAYADDGDFRISSTGFANLEPSLSSQLGSFSGEKIFANISSNAWHTEFEVAGEETPASVQGFGAVFTDVDVAGSSFLEFFSGDTSLGKFFAPVHDAKSTLSFVGAYFENGRVTKILIHHGDGTIAAGNKDVSNGGTFDIVAMDDFLYDEPKALK